MQWLEIHIDTNPAALEATETFLSVQGIDNIVIDDEGEFNAFLAANRAAWDDADDALRDRERGRCRVTFYLPADEGGFAALAGVRLAFSAFRREHPESAPALMTLEHLEDADWENNWKRYYRPMEIGRRLLVIPSWEKTDPGERTPLYLDPGLTFGTGSHATTRLCLTALEARLRGGEFVADLGCGSGILSIAALKLGAAAAFACDIDEKCPEVAYANAALNGIGPETYTVRCADVLSDAAVQASLAGRCDVVLANIVADVILALAPMVRGLLRPQGTFICSGIISERAVEVADGLRLHGLAILESHESDGWMCFVCR
jgi:ribosomal protein L11 methyltransferase